MTTTLSSRRIADVAPMLRSGTVSSVDLVSSCLAAIDARPEVNAFITVLRDRALEQARRADAEIRSGTWRGPLHGVPLAVKDLIDLSGVRTTSGSAVPSAEATADAPVVRRLREAGAILLGKTNLHEFAFGTTSDESAFGPVRHPRDGTRSAGGSSGGSAAALAAGMCLGALGTDTGGSIRIPSAACGTVGLKPTFDELSAEGVVPLSTTLDHVGPMARSVQDAALLYQVMKGAPPEGVRPAEGPLVFGIPRRYCCERVDSGVARALARAVGALQRAGHACVETSISHVEWTPDVYLHIVLPEAASYHAVALEHHASSYSPGVRLRLEMGRYVLAEDYVRAMELRRVLRAAVDGALEGCDALLLPALAVAAPPLGAATVEIDGAPEPTRAAMLRLTQIFNVTGHPALALPGTPGDDGLPRGLQLVGRRDATESLMGVAAAVEDQISGGAGSVGGGTG